VSNLGNGAGAEDGKFHQESKNSTARFTGDEFGNYSGAEDGNCFSPGFS